MVLRFFCLWTVILSFLFLPFEAEAQRRRGKNGERYRNPAQAAEANENEEDIFDPFADFSEFESNRDEQEDINFFKHGRMLTMGFQSAWINFTKEMAEKYQSSMRYGLFISYFFDLNFAVQLNWHTGDSAVSLRSLDSNRTGSANFNSLGFAVKYFLNTQNVTKGLANLNPYFLVGMSNYTRTVRVEGAGGYIQDRSNGLSGGMGIEVPMLRKKLFWGAQISYDLVSFSDENTSLQIESNNYGTAKGDLWHLTGTIGINF